MSYHLTATGHTHDEATEKRLHAELAEILGKPEYGVSASRFDGTHVNGTIHEHATAAAEHAHQAHHSREAEDQF